MLAHRDKVKASLHYGWTVCLVLSAACGSDVTMTPGSPTPEPERCDGVDNDLDGQVDEGFDNDGDGYVAGGTCEGIPALDCDDSDPSIHPGAQETCDNAIDEDCDGQPNQSQPWYEDADGDGYGTSDRTEWTCMPPEGYVPVDGDCDDLDPRFNPDAEEEADATDLNCDGVVSFSLDPYLGVESQEAFSPLFGTLVITIPPGSIDTASILQTREADESNEVVISVGLSESLQPDLGIWTHQSLEQALLSPFFEFSPSLVFSKPATIQYPIDPRLLDWQPDVSCDWLGVYQVGSSGQPLEDPLPTVECDLGQATLTVSMAHFSSYQVRGLSTLVELEPVYLDQDLPPQAPIVQVDSGVAFTRSWRFTLAGEPIADMKSAFEVEGGDSGFESISLIEAEWDPDSERYHITLRAINQETATRQLEALVFASSGVTRLGTTTGVCPVQGTVCTASTIDDAGGEEVDCSHACGEGSTCYDFDADKEADIFECMTLEVAPDPDPVDDDGDTFTESMGDCDDTNAAVYPGATEICDGVDNDCDQRIDDEDAGVQDQTPYYLDADGDGYGEAIAAGESCSDPPSGYTRQTGDCNDTTSAARPGGEEVCDDLDNNCDGQTDEGLKSTFYQDSDGDGYGSSAASLVACSAPPGYTPTAGDCNDGDMSVHPNADEYCNDTDDDCDGQIDEGVLNNYYQDTDNDGYGDTISTTQACTVPSGYVGNDTDCDDADTSIHPNASETCNGLDDDCDGSIDDGLAATYYYQDTDQDSYGNDAVSTQACVAPPGFVSRSGDCDDGEANVNPGATESCNGVDDNCDGLVDKGLTSTYYQDADHDGYGTPSVEAEACSPPSGYSTIKGDCNDSNASIHPGAQEVCNGVDDDCNTQIDNGVLNTFYRDSDGDGYGDAHSTTQACATSDGWVDNSVDCNDSDNQIYPGHMGDAAGWPRIGVLWLDSVVTDPCDIARYNLVVDNGAVSNNAINHLAASLGLTAAEISRLLHQLNPDLKLLKTLVLTSFQAGGDPDPTTASGWSDDFLLHNTSGVPIHLDGDPNAYIINLGDPAAVDFVVNQTVQYMSSTNVYDGIFYSSSSVEPVWISCSDGNEINVDMDSDGVPDDCCSIVEKWSGGQDSGSGLQGAVNRIADYFGPSMPIYLNGSNNLGSRVVLLDKIWGVMDTSVWQWPFQYDVLTSYAPHDRWLHGLYQERSKATAVIQSYDDWSSPRPTTGSPTLLGGDETDLQMMRYGLVSALLAGVAYGYDDGETSHGDPWWYDEYDNAGAGSWYLGSSLPLVPPSATGPVIVQSTFDSSDEGWDTWGYWSEGDVPCVDHHISISSSRDTSDPGAGTGSLRVEVVQSDEGMQDYWDWTAEAFIEPIQVLPSTDYTVTFWARASPPGLAQVSLWYTSPWEELAYTVDIMLVESWQQFALPMTTVASETPDTTPARLQFALGPRNSTVWLDEVTLIQGRLPMVWRRDFEHGVALLNLEDSEQVINVEGTYSTVDSDQAGDVVAGSDTTQVTLQPWDGAVLIK